jgi:hypothetical protein
MTINNFDWNNVESMSIRVEDIPARKLETPASKRHEAKRRQEFIKVPLVWSQLLARPKHAYTRAVADCLLFLEWKAKGGSVKLSNVALQPWGVSPRDKSRALEELEKLGLIAIERGHGKSPRITLLKLNN